MGRRAIITGVGHYAPQKVLSNRDLEKMVDTNDEWIVSRTGIRERRILEGDLATSFMGYNAAKMILDEKNMSADEIDAIFVATVTPDTMFPNTACRIQEMLGASNAWGLDFNGACTGFIYTLTTAAQYIETGKYKKILVIGADKMSSIVDYTDRTTCILFGDAAGAVLLEPGEEKDMGILDAILRSDGSGGEYLHMLAGGSLHPASHETVDKKMHTLYQDGQKVFKFAVRQMADVSAEILEKNGLSGKDVKFFIPHQANLRIIDAAARRMKLEKAQVVINIDRYGNTTAATIPLALSEIYHDGKLQKGDNVVIAAFGAGFTWGSLLFRWSI